MAEQRLAGYRIEREIARSSIASIYEAHQESLDRRVLLKRLHPQLADDAEIRARFEREARALAKIKHKNIVHIYDYRADADLVMLAAEWITGGTLAQHMQERPPLREREAVALAMDVLEGLAVAHRAGIVHRDIKPSNLLISASGAIKITDFGLAQFEGSPALTQQGATMGTPAYLAPELLAGEPATPRSDLYNLGVTLYELLTGRNPFLADNLSQTLSNITTVRLAPLEGVHDELNELLLSLTDKRPQRRPASAGEALERLRPLARQLGVERGWEALSREGAGGPYPAAGGGIRPRRRRPPSWVLALSWGMMVGVLALVWGLHPLLTPPPPPPEVEVADTTAAPPPQVPIPEPAATDTVPDAPPEEETVRETAEPTAAPVERPAEEADGGEPELQRDETGGPDREDTQPPAQEEPEAGGSGYLSIMVTPWANLYLDERFLALTPITRPLELPAGKQELTLLNPKFPPVTRTFHIPPGDTARATVNLFELVGAIHFIDASPWAEVYLDEEYIGRTPIGSTFYLLPGEHTLLFRHPELGTVEKQVTVQPGREDLRVVVEMDQRP